MTPLAHRIAKGFIPKGYWPTVYLTRLVQRSTGMRVSSGPFAGLRYVEESAEGAYIPRLLGIYERELIPIIEGVVKNEFQNIVIIGAAEGFYAVGFAFRIQNATVVAFEMDKNGRELMAKMATLNRVSDRVVIHGKCEPEGLRRHLKVRKRTFVLCDVEGYESELMDPGRVPELANTYMLVELHEFKQAGITDVVISRFESTHDVRHIWQQERTAADFPYSNIYTRLMPRRYLEWAVSEWRPGRMSWLWLQPKGIC